MIRKRANQSAGSARRGITIIEVLVVTTGVVLLLGVCAVTIKLLMRLNTAGQERLSAAMAHDRLAHQLRDDVHDCESAQLADPLPAQAKPARLQLTFQPDHLITYEVRPESVVRDETLAGKPVRHESYALPRDRVARFEQREQGAHRLVALVVTHVPGKSRTDPPRELEIVALPGKHRALPSRKPGGQP
jgi:hypothetical protein